MSLYALTVRNPWAWAILHGKPVENRSWPPPGWLTELAIHAGARSGWDEDGEFSPLVTGAWQEHVKTLSPGNAVLRRNSPHIDFSAVTAVATVGGFHHADDCASACDPWCARDQWHWEFPVVRPLAAPVPCKGRQGLWPLPLDVESAVRAQLADPPMETPKQVADELFRRAFGRLP